MRTRLFSLVATLVLICSTLFSQGHTVLAQEWYEQAPDIDGDGLTNELESSGWYSQAGGPFVTNIQDADSDDDGLSDGEEKLFDTDPLDDTSPGFYVKYDGSYQTREYFHTSDPAYLSVKRGGGQYLMTEAMVVRRGTTLHIGGPADATLSISGSGMTNLSSRIERDLYGGGWTVDFPSWGTVGEYTATISRGGWQEEVPIYTIFEIPTPVSSSEYEFNLTEEHIRAVMYDETPGTSRDETTVIWKVWDPYVYTRRCDAGYSEPCYNEDNFYHGTGGWAQAFPTEQYQKWIFLDKVLPRIHGLSDHGDAVEALSYGADQEVRVEYSNAATMPEGPPKSYQISYVLYRYWDGVGETQIGTPCYSQAGAFASFLRSAGIPAQTFITDWWRGEYDTSVEIWFDGRWWGGRSYKGGEDDNEDWAKYYPFSRGPDGHTPHVYLRYWDTYGGYKETNSHILVVARETWDYDMVNTDRVTADPLGRDYRWYSSHPLEMNELHPDAETLNAIIWIDGDWVPDGWYLPETYVLPNPYPGGDIDENWPIEPVPQACPPGYLGDCPYPAGGPLFDDTTPQESAVQPSALDQPVAPAVPNAVEIGSVTNVHGVDSDGNGTFEELVVDADVTVHLAGDYAFGAKLAIPEGMTAYDGIYADTDLARYEPGQHTIQIRFDAQDIGRAQADGPYVVRDLWATDLEEFDARLGPWEEVLDVQPSDYATAEYTADEFAPIEAAFSGEFSHHGVDENGDGRYEAISIDVTLINAQSGIHRVEGDLFDYKGEYVGHADWEGLGSRASLEFALGKSSPPYTLGNLKLFHESGKMLDVQPKDAYAVAALDRPVQDGLVTMALVSEEAVDQLLFGEHITPTHVYDYQGIDLDGDDQFEQLQFDVEVSVSLGGNYRIEGWLAGPDGSLITYAASDSTALDVGLQTLSLHFDGRAISDSGSDGDYSVVALRVLSGETSGYDVLDVVEETGVALPFDAADFEPATDLLTIFSDDMEQGTDNWSWDSPWNLDNRHWPESTHVWEASASGNDSGVLDTVSLDLSRFIEPRLRFKTTFMMDSADDVGYVEVSPDGSVWTELTQYTNATNLRLTELLDLGAFEGTSDLILRFNAESHSELLWYVDDVVLEGWPAVDSASFTHAPQPILTNQDTTFVASYDSITDTMPITYTWDFDDGSALVVTHSPATTHQFPAWDEYAVQLTVENPFDSAVYSETVTAYQPVTAADFEAATVDPERDWEVGFTSTHSPAGATQPVTYTWNFSDGSGAVVTTSTSITHEFPTTDTYTVWLTATNGYGEPIRYSQDVTVPRDEDVDGIRNSVDGIEDTDGDGVPNYLDTDSDGDTIPDSGEWSAGTADALAGCTADDPVCTDNDVDGDGTPNFVDSDSDDDYAADVLEGTGDYDGDGVPNYLQFNGIIFMPLAMR